MSSLAPSLLLSCAAVHVESLVREIAPALDAAVTAQLLLNAVNVNLVRYLRRAAGMSLATIKASMRPLIAGQAFTPAERPA